MNIDRLRNVARALRESVNPAAFNMNMYLWGDALWDDDAPDGIECNTPACAFGHYVARTDLQDAFAIRRIPEECGGRPLIVSTRYDALVTHDDDIALAHFGITSLQAAQLFGDEYGASRWLDAFARGALGERTSLTRADFLVLNAKTAAEAADWIDRWIDQNWANSLEDSHGQA